MRGRPDDDIPTPRLVAAWLLAGPLATERVPLWAAHWLAQGLDGDGLRALAGLHGDDPHEVRALLSAALQDAGVDPGDPNLHDDRRRAAIEVTYSDVARLWKEGRASERWVLDKVVEVVTDNNYEDIALEPPLGRLWGLDDEWDAGWGRPTEVLREVVAAACRQQLGDSR